MAKDSGRHADIVRIVDSDRRGDAVAEQMRVYWLAKLLLGPMRDAQL